jgi:hypothetical protein
MTQTGRVLPLATGNLKHQTALSVAYGTGLRASEVVALKVGDVDSQRMTLSIEQGKGRRDRYRIQTRWGEGHSYHDPEVSTPNLRAWFKQMIQKYPSMNGPLAPQPLPEDDPRLTDYSVGREIIYAAFAWSVAEDAYKTMFTLAARHNVGFFNVSSDKGEVWRPNGKGGLELESRR